MKVDYRTSDTCSRTIDIELDGERVVALRFNGGCHGNAQGVAALVAGQPVAEIVQRLRGIECGGKGTSWPDPLARALGQALVQKAS